MHPSAERREDAKAPVADLVAEALDDNGAVGGNRARALFLFAQVGEQVPGRTLVQGVPAGELADGPLVVEADELARGPPDRLPELEGAADPFAPPEGDQAGDARSRRYENAIAGDLLDAPGRRAEEKRLAGAGLVDHFLVELADA